MGEPPPLPRDLRGAAPLWVAVAVLLVLGYAWGRVSGVGGELQREVDRAVEEAIAGIRVGTTGGAVRTLEESAGWWALMIWVRWLIVAALALTRRWRHLAVFVGSVIVVDVLARWFPTAGPEGTGIAAHPSPAAAGLAVTMLGIVYGLVPTGRPRHVAQAVTAVLWLVVAWILLVTREDTFWEIVVGGAIGFSVPFLAYRIVTPERIFPVTYRRGRAAHLDVEGRRGEAIRAALADQLGIEAVSVEPFGLEGSGGSTPLAIVTSDGARLFGKLYATNHLRADRWYKLGRSARYGALEDERSFNSVRRMVEYEDHMLRYLRDSGIGVAEPFGFAELTPEREYLIVTAFVDDAVELTHADIDGRVIDAGVGVVRAFWDAGIAHRDLKPANLLVRGGRDVVPIDVFFCQVRPSPWRQSVDLANMLLCLSLRSDAPAVYAAALERFTPDEVAEAFAASRGVTIPGQLRAMLRSDPRDLVGAFRDLAPPRDVVRIQRWTARRLAMLAALLAITAGVVVVTVLNLRWAGFQP